MNKKTVLISGASRGIGRAAALAFAREQDNLIITCQKNKELLDQVKQEAEAKGSVAWPLPEIWGIFLSVRKCSQKPTDMDSTRIWSSTMPASPISDFYRIWHRRNGTGSSAPI